MLTKCCLFMAPMVVTFWLAAAAAAQEPKRLQEFALQEYFGVSHADQVVVFDLKQKADPSQCHLLYDAG
jgi:hypothetical protein